MNTLFENNMDMIQPELLAQLPGMGFESQPRLQVTDWMKDLHDDNYFGINRNYKVVLDSGDDTFIFFSCGYTEFVDSYRLIASVEYVYPYSKYKGMRDYVGGVEGDNRPINLTEFRNELSTNKYVGLPIDFIEEMINDSKKFLDMKEKETGQKLYVES